MLDQPELVRGKAVLDVGTGSGLVAIAAARAGAARVQANDVDPRALEAAARNALHAGVTLELVPGDAAALPPPEVVLAGDVLSFVEWAGSLVPWLEGCARAGSSVLVADPQRTFRPRAGWHEVACVAAPADTDVPHAPPWPTRVWRLEAKE